MKRILIVEDDVMIATELGELLRNAGYEAVVLRDFGNALEEILASGADLLLLDINIPYQNGEVLLREIRRKSGIPGRAIIIYHSGRLRRWLKLVNFYLTISM